MRGLGLHGGGRQLVQVVAAKAQLLLHQPEIVCKRRVCVHGLHFIHQQGHGVQWRAQPMRHRRGGQAQGNHLFITEPALTEFGQLSLLLAQPTGQRANHQQQHGGGDGKGGPHAHQVQLGQVGIVVFMGQRRVPQHHGGVEAKTDDRQSNAFAQGDQDDGNGNGKQQQRDKRVGVASGEEQPGADQEEIKAEPEADRNRQTGRPAGKPEPAKGCQYGIEQAYQQGFWPVGQGYHGVGDGNGDQLNDHDGQAHGEKVARRLLKTGL